MLLGQALDFCFYFCMFGSAVGSALLPVPSAVFAVWAMNKIKQQLNQNPPPYTIIRKGSGNASQDPKASARNLKRPIKSQEWH